MPTINRFEDIESWKEARKLTLSLYTLCQQAPLSSDRGLCDQIRRASVSIMANIAEGYGRNGNKEFSHFLSNAKGSATELKSHLYVLLDLGHTDPKQFDPLYEQINYIEILLTRLRDYLLKTDIRGSKFKK